MIKRRLLAAVLVLVGMLALHYYAHAQVSVTGHWKDASGNPIAGDARNYLKWDLLYAGANVTVVPSSTRLPSKSFIYKPSALGVISMSIYGNDVIKSGTTVGGTRWQLTEVIDGSSGPSCQLNITGSTLDLDSRQCDNATAPSVSPAPTDNVYLRKDGGNSPVTGAVEFSAGITSTSINVGTGGLTTIANANGGFGPVPLGPDLPIFVQGPADVVNWSKPYSLNSSTSVGSTGLATITVSSTANYYTNIPGSPTSLYIENRGNAQFEALTAGTSTDCASLTPPSGKWCIASSTTIVANFTKTHASTPYPVWQYGAVLNRAYNVAQTAQDGTNLWYMQQDASTAPYYWSWHLGSGTALFQYGSGGTSFFAGNYLDSSGSFGLTFGGNQAVIQTGANDFTTIRDKNSVQQAKFWNTSTELSGAVKIGGTDSAHCELKHTAGPVLQARLADDSGDCTVAVGQLNAQTQLSINSGNGLVDSTGKGTFKGGIQAGASGSTISDTRELIQSAHSCGTTTTCTNSTNQSNRMIWGYVTLSSATPSTATVTGISPAFTSSGSYICIASNQTTQANPVKIVPVSGSSFTVTGPNTVTDVIAYACIGN